MSISYYYPSVFDVELARTDDGATLTSKYKFTTDSPIELDSNVMDELSEWVDEYNIRKWDGFGRRAVGVFDGGGFSLEIELSTGESIKAYGTNAYPDDSDAAFKRFWEIMDAAIEKAQYILNHPSDEELATRAEISSKVPSKYFVPFEGEQGTVELIKCRPKGSLSSFFNEAYVYLPAGYDESKQYNVVYLLSGCAFAYSDEYDWDLGAEDSNLKKILDRMMGEGSIQPCIVVALTPDYDDLKPYMEDKPDLRVNVLLRTGLIPYIESHYSTYADYSENGYDLSDTRNHRAIAGCSRGALEAINIGIGECMDLFNYFGAFDAFSYGDAHKLLGDDDYPNEPEECVDDAETVAAHINESEYSIGYFYTIYETCDEYIYFGASSAVTGLPDLTDKIIEGENYISQVFDDADEHTIRYRGIYNFMQLVFLK